jgi:beta-lactamase superfamily II metal-dependent hydrolase
MSRIKSFSVGEGDMYYIDHNSDSFTIIDCLLNDESRKVILDQIVPLQQAKGISRFISTHPDEDHLLGLPDLDEKAPIVNFYCVKNKVTKEEETESFTKYCELRDSDKAFYIYKGCKRKWLNEKDETRGAAGISILWPDLNNEHFKAALEEAEAGGSPNNISAIIKYAQENGVTTLWFGDLHRDFIKEIEDEIDVQKADIVFAPHHGRRTGRIPRSLLTRLGVKIVVIGEAAVEHLDHYAGFKTIEQNKAGDVIFDCEGSQVHVFTSKECYVDFLDDEGLADGDNHYLGTLNLK